MRNFISEDDIEQAILQKLEGDPFQYGILRCDPSPDKRELLPDGTGRSSKKECVLPLILREALARLNPDIPGEKLEEIARDLCRDFSATDMTATNYKYYNQIRNGIKISLRRNGKEDFDFVKLVDFDRPENNTFTAVSQMWIQGRVYWRRPDVLIFINGLPMVFVELKNSIVKVEEAYNDNLKNYLRDIPNLFAFNQICVLSNGLETRLGAFNATYNHFFEWLKVNSEKERPDRQALKEAGTVGESSVRYFIDGLLQKGRLIDYIENFIMFRNQKNKIIAKNHQYFGVNNLMESVKNRAELQGKLGVFWHTQGSGKSFSMVFFARKVRRKISGNFTFLIITDREDLDDQIHKNFVKTEVIGQKEECQPKNGKQLRDYLQTNKSFIFTLIHKFRYDKGKKYPVLSTRDDIIVLVDEAHRTQYKDLAENMRTALPNANYIAFTGTPLLGSKRLTNQWFGNYVSEYNFAQSVEDGSTVPMFYSRRVPEVGLENDFLDDDVVDIIEEENLNEDETRLLENSSSRILEVIKREDRIDKIAQDIVFLDCGNEHRIEEEISAIYKAHTEDGLSIVDLEARIPGKGYKAYHVDKECKLSIICFDEHINVDQPRIVLRGREEKRIYTAIDLMYMLMFSSEVSQIAEFDSDEKNSESQVLSWGGASDYFTVFLSEKGFISKGAIEYSNVYSEVDTSAAHIFSHYLELGGVFPFHLSSTIFADPECWNVICDDNSVYQFTRKVKALPGGALFKYDNGCSVFLSYNFFSIAASCS